VWFAKTPARREINYIAAAVSRPFCYKSGPCRFLGLCFGMLVRLFRRRHSLLLENLALRQQVVVLKRRRATHLFVRLGKNGVTELPLNESDTPCTVMPCAMMRAPERLRRHAGAIEWIKHNQKGS